MRDILRSFIVLYSEAVWICFTILLFSDRQWTQGPAADMLWWLVAAAAGYALHAALAGRIHYLALTAASVLILGFLLYKNWQTVAVESGFMYKGSVTVAAICLFARGVFFAYRRPTRLNMLGRFEGNVVFYLIFLLLYTAKGWPGETLHLMFLAAIFASLMGMTLTLQSHGEEQDQAEVRTAGRAGWFAGIVALLAAGIVLLTLMLLLPAVRNGMRALAFALRDGVLALYSLIRRLFLWLMQWLPDPEPAEMELEPIRGAAPDLSEMLAEEAALALPIPWILGVLAALAALSGIVLAALLFRQARLPKGVKRSRVSVRRSSSLSFLLEWFNRWRRSLVRKWRLSFPRYYRLEMYWVFRQVQRWGARNGMPRLASETPREFVEKLSRRLQDQDALREDPERAGQLVRWLRKLGRDYEAAYYGRKPVDSAADHRVWLRRLQKLRFAKTPLQGGGGRPGE